MEKNEPVEVERQEKDEAKSISEEIIREGARKMLQAAIEQEVAEYILSGLITFTPSRHNSPTGKMSLGSSRAFKVCFTSHASKINAYPGQINSL